MLTIQCIPPSLPSFPDPLPPSLTAPITPPSLPPHHSLHPFLTNEGCSGDETEQEIQGSDAHKRQHSGVITFDKLEMREGGREGNVERAREGMKKEEGQ